jgi:hypothetical protein
MPWLPLAILLIAALTIAALTLILFPPGEGGVQAGEGDITDRVGEESDEDIVADGDRHPPGTHRSGSSTRLRGEGDESHSESGASVGPTPPPERKLQSQD